MLKTNWRYLQVFAEGGEGSTGGEGSSEGSAATVAAAPGDDGQQRLRDLGVPENVLKRHMARRSHAGAQEAPAATQPQTQQAPAPAQEEHPAEDQQAQEEPQEEKPQGETLKLADVIKDHPELNAEVQSIIKSRLKGEKGSEKALKQLAPLLSAVAGRYDIDLNSDDPNRFKALMDAYNQDAENYQDIALEKGITSAQARDEAMEAIRQQEYDAHFHHMEQQAQDFQKIVPGFDLRAEMQNPVFARITAPGCLSVEDAYHATHWREIQQATAQATARQTQQQISNAIRSGTKRPAENGTSSQAPSVSTFNYGNASREQREAFKAELRRAWGRGEVVRPGSFRGNR